MPMYTPNLYIHEEMKRERETNSVVDIRCHVHFFSIGCHGTLMHSSVLVLMFVCVFFLLHPIIIFVLFLVVFFAGALLSSPHSYRHSLARNDTWLFSISNFQPSLPLSFHFILCHRACISLWDECVCVFVFVYSVPLFDVILCCYAPLHYYYYFFVTGRKLFETESKLISDIGVAVRVACTIFKPAQIVHSML